MSERANWRAKELADDSGWIYTFDASERKAMRDAVLQAPKRERLLDYRKGDFDLASAGALLAQALEQVKHGRGVAVLRGLPREHIGEDEFALLTWAIGLHSGVARPQGAKTQYISAVRDEGTVYRSGRGRGYSSSAQLDYHTDSADLVFLSCYNRAVSGGLSLTTSSLAAYDEMQKEHPSLVRWLREPLHFSRQGEEAPDEGPTCEQPVYDIADGSLVCRWNWNRVNSAQQLEGMECYDAIVRQPGLVHDFWMEPGDLQIINSHRTLHSRTAFEDHEDASLKRLMYRLWIAPADSAPLPASWAQLFRHIEPGVVRGGIRGMAYDDKCEAFERRQATDAGVGFLP